MISKEKLTKYTVPKKYCYGFITLYYLFFKLVHCSSSNSLSTNFK